MKSYRTTKLAVLAAVLALVSVCANAQQVASLGVPAASDHSKSAPAPRREPAVQAPITPPSLSLSPAVVLTKGSFGQSITQTLMLTNGTPHEMAFEMIAEDVVVRDGKRVFVPAGELKGSVAATAVFSSPAVVVKPFSAGSVEVRFTMPPASDIRAVVAMFRGTNKIPSASGSVSMTASLGTLITFTMSDNFHVFADAITASDQSDAANAVVAQWLTNTGSEPIVPSGMLAVLDASGTLVSKAPMPAQRLLPGERLEFKAECPTPLPAGHYRVLASYEFEGQTITKAGELVVQ